MGRALWAACAVAAACAVGAWGAHAGAAATASVAERLRTASGEPVRSRPLGAGATPTDLREAEPQGPPEGGPDAQVPFDRLDLDRDGTITRSEWEKYYADHPQKDEITATVAKYSQGGSGFTPALVNSFMMIIVTELGDKTFFIAAILAMSHPRMAVFGGAISALVLMTVLSVIIGFALPALIPRSLTHFASALLFLYFGGKLLVEARSMESSGPSDELKEVEEELQGGGGGGEDGDAEEDAEKGKGGAAEARGTTGRGAAEKGHKHLPLWCSHVVDSLGGELWVVITLQAFVMTFVAEWGDRSQIATIALAAAKDPYGVALGGFVGHALCTGLAVVGGRLLAARISERTVALAGGALFVFFGLHSLFFSA